MPVAVRYVVADVETAIAFYTGALGFTLDIHPAPGFARLSRGELHILLNRSGAGGAGQSMPDGQQSAPGGWHRMQIEIRDLDGTVASLKGKGHRCRSGIVVGSGGKQVLIEDSSGNPVELFEPVPQ
jgi:predicted enzyme related to lactoylglutathione lyase